MATDEPEVITLEDRINALEVELARLRETPGTLGWPNDPTIAQGFLGHRWQRRDGATPTGGLPPTYVSEAPADGYYYGRQNFTWQQVVEEAPSLTARRSATGWARASFGADVPWISLDDVLAGYVEEAPSDPPAVPWVRGAGVAAGWHQLANFLSPYAPLASPVFTGEPSAPTPPTADISARLATTQFVNALLAANPAGIPDVPATNGAYARFRSGGTTDWIDFTALGVASLNSPQFTGVPTAPTPPAGIASDQVATAQFVLSSPAFIGNPTGPTPPIGDASARLATTNFVARDALMKVGGQMSGPLITIPGASTTNVGIGIGDNATGFYRVGNTLAVAISGELALQWLALTRETMSPWPLNMAVQRITNLADATAAGDALNQRTGDARYVTLAGGGIVAGPMQLLQSPFLPTDVTNKNYVDQRRAPTIVYDLPANVAIPGDSTWRQIATIPVTIPRGGNTLIMATISCNIVDFPQGTLGLVGVRFNAGTPERQVWVYGYGTPSNLANGFTASLTIGVTGSDVINVPIEVTSITVGSSPPAFTIVGGAAVATRSQIVIVDLGPTGGSADAVEENPGAGSEQRDAARPDRGRHARTPARAR